MSIETKKKMFENLKKIAKEEYGIVTRKDLHDAFKNSDPVDISPFIVKPR